MKRSTPKPIRERATKAWAVVLWYGAIPPGLWGQPHGLLAVYRSRDLADNYARADAHTDHPSRVVRVEIRSVPRKARKRARRKA